jgi:hypothetical protein
VIHAAVPVQVCGVNNNELSTALSSPKKFRELIAANLQLNTRAPQTFVPLSAQQSASYLNAILAANTRAKKITTAVTEKLTDRQGFKFPASASLLAGMYVFCSCVSKSLVLFVFFGFFLSFFAPLSLISLFCGFELNLIIFFCV